MGSIFSFLFVLVLRFCHMRSTVLIYVTVFLWCGDGERLGWLVCFHYSKKHQAQRIAAIKQQETECDASCCERKCLYNIITYYAKLFLTPASRVPANIEFLVILMFLIFERPFRIRFRIHLVSAVIKCYWTRPTE